MPMQQTMTQDEVLALQGRSRQPATSLDIDRPKRPTKNRQYPNAFSITLRLPLTNDNNGQSKHWRTSSDRRKEYEDELISAGHKRDEPFRDGVTLLITRVLGRNQKFWDHDSILRGSAKQLVDSLVAVGWFVDDSPKHIAKVIGEQDDTRRTEGPAIQITVFH